MNLPIHFIGVGKMGLPMAAHLKAAGHHVTVSDPDPARLALAAGRGLPSARSEAWSSGKPAKAACKRWP